MPCAHKCFTLQLRRRKPIFFKHNFFKIIKRSRFEVLGLNIIKHVFLIFPIYVDYKIKCVCVVNILFANIAKKLRPNSVLVLKFAELAFIVIIHKTHM